MSNDISYISSCSDEETSCCSETSYLDYEKDAFFSYSDDEIISNKKPNVYLVFIFNRRNVVWHEANSDYTVANVFQDLEKLYNIKKCMLDIGQHTFLKPNNLLLQPLMQNKLGCDIHVSMKDELVDHCVQNNMNHHNSNSPV